MNSPYLVGIDCFSVGGVDSGADAVLPRVRLSSDRDEADRLRLRSGLGRRHSFHEDTSVTHRLRYR